MWLIVVLNLRGLGYGGFQRSLNFFFLLFLSQLSELRRREWVWLTQWRLVVVLNLLWIRVCCIFEGINFLFLRLFFSLLFAFLNFFFFDRRGLKAEPRV